VIALLYYKNKKNCWT